MRRVALGNNWRLGAYGRAWRLGAWHTKHARPRHSNDRREPIIEVGICVWITVHSKGTRKHRNRWAASTLSFSARYSNVWRPQCLPEQYLVGPTRDDGRGLSLSRWYQCSTPRQDDRVCGSMVTAATADMIKIVTSQCSVATPTNTVRGA